MTHLDVGVDTAPLVVGRFGKTFGILGWIKVISFTTPNDNILKFNPWLVQKSDRWEEVYIEKSRKHSSSIVVKLPNCSSPEEASLFTNAKIGVWRKQIPKLKDNEYYWSDLYGLEVVNKEGINLGVVQELIATGSNDVLVVVGKKRCLIPYLSNVILKVDLSNETIQVDWPEDFL
jgi:16S rRNA processing protein RimM